MERLLHFLKPKRIVSYLLGLNLFSHFSLQFSMKPLSKHVEIAIVQEPRTIALKRLFGLKEAAIHIPARTLYSLESPIVYGQAGLISAHGDLCSESTSWPPEVELMSLGRPPKKSKTHLPEPVVVVGDASYYHFLIENLGAALVAQQMVPEATFLIPRSRHRYVNELADMLGPNCKRYRKNVQVESAIFLSRYNTLGRPQPAELQMLSSFSAEMVSKFDHSPNRGSYGSELSVYISRRNSSRSLELEQVLEEILKEAGFLIAYPEKMSLLDQMRLFSNTRVLVGPHGAGLANASFMKSGKRLVVEILDPKWPNHCFEILAKERNFAFHRILQTGDMGQREIKDLADEIVEISQAFAS